MAIFVGLNYGLPKLKSNCALKSNDLVLVGDSVRADYALARALDIDFIALTWGSSSRNDFLAAGLDASCIIDTLEELQLLFFS